MANTSEEAVRENVACDVRAVELEVRRKFREIAIRYDKELANAFAEAADRVQYIRKVA